MAIQVNDIVLLFGEYEGIVLEIKEQQALVYCPSFSKEEPYVITTMDNITMLDNQSFNKLIS